MDSSDSKGHRSAARALRRKVEDNEETLRGLEELAFSGKAPGFFKSKVSALMKAQKVELSERLSCVVVPQNEAGTLPTFEMDACFDVSQKHLPMRNGEKSKITVFRGSSRLNIPYNIPQAYSCKKYARKNSFKDYIWMQLSSYYQGLEGLESPSSYQIRISSTEVMVVLLSGPRLLITETKLG